MAITMFFGSLIGTLFGLTVRTRALAIYGQLGRNPTLAQRIGLVILGFAFFLALALYKFSAINPMMIYWGSLFAYGFITCFLVSIFWMSGPASKESYTTRLP